MKKTIVTFVLAAFCVMSLNAQPRGLGGRFGYGSQELSYQHYIMDQFLECDFGTANFQDIQLHATYNWIIAAPAWTPEGQWYLYGGAGIGGGYFSQSSDHDAYGFVGLAGQLGLEYQFRFPMALSIDIRPVIGPKFGDGGGFYNQWLYMFLPCIGVRYLF